MLPAQQSSTDLYRFVEVGMGCQEKPCVCVCVGGGGGGGGGGGSDAISPAFAADICALCPFAEPCNDIWQG